MRKKKNLWSGVSILIVAVLVITAFIRGNAQAWLLAAAFVIWAVWATYYFLVPYIKEELHKREAKRIRKKCEKQDAAFDRFIIPEVSDPVEQVLLRHANYRISAYLIECSHGKIIFDCGWHRNMSPDGVFDKKAQIKSLGSLPLYVTNQGRIEKGLAIDEQLAALGIHPADLDLVLLSHLDCDHTNGLNLVADAKQILVSKDELLFAENKTPVNRIRYNADWWRSTKMQTFDWNGTEGLAGKSYDVFGDESLVMVNIPGHSKGLCALKITGSDGRFILLLRRWRLRPKIVGAADHIRHCR